MLNRPLTTLFMLMSVDGKISTGSNDERDVDKDFPSIAGLQEGLYQYYELEQTTDLWSLNSGRVMAKLGINEQSASDIKKTSVNFVVIDDGELTEIGVKNMALKSQTLYLATKRENEVLKDKELGLNIVWDFYDDKLNFASYFAKLKKEYGCEKLTIQTGGTLNSLFVRAGLVDYLYLVVAPCLIGGKDTMSLMAGNSLTTDEDLKDIKTLKFISARSLEDSYLELKYKVNYD